MRLQNHAVRRGSAVARCSAFPHQRGDALFQRLKFGKLAAQRDEMMLRQFSRLRAGLPATQQR